MMFDGQELSGSDLDAALDDRAKVKTHTRVQSKEDFLEVIERMIIVVVLGTIAVIYGYQIYWAIQAHDAVFLEQLGSYAVAALFGGGTITLLHGKK